MVVTMPDMPAHRGRKLTAPAVKLQAREYGIPVIQPAKLSPVPKEIADLKDDVFVVAAYGNMLPRELLKLPLKGTLNAHPSLLPRHRGPSPVQTALLEGDRETGVTLIALDDKMDHGPIVLQRRYDGSLEEIRSPELERELGTLAGSMLLELIPLWLKGKITPAEQDHGSATFTRKMAKEDGRIDWNRSAGYIARQIRALDPWPGTYTLFQGKNLKILKAREIKEQSYGKPGGAVALPQGFGIQTGDGILEILELQLEGRKPASAKDFLLGHRDIIGTVFE
ncbi:MAG: methionyl-tRNA formyltransferase, partial [bacterium]|nr:methionyl-tRNA formyltransferase [bacterium]